MLTRRTALKTGVLGAGALALTSRAPAFAADRPVLQALQVGDPTTSGGLVWGRADRAGTRLVVKAANQTFTGPGFDPGADLTAKAQLGGLPSGSWVQYQAYAEDTLTGATSDIRSGWIRTAPATAQDVKFTWGADICGQGWGIDSSRGGLQIFNAVNNATGHFHLCVGDATYADAPMSDTRTLADGTVWRNLVTPAKQKVAESLDEFRGQWAYPFNDPSFAQFSAETPQLHLWDDHDVHNDWYPGQILDDARYTERRIDVLAARARQAMLEWTPTASTERYRKVSYGPLLDVFMLDDRTFRGANDKDSATSGMPPFLGPTQVSWLLNGLKTSTARWKVLALSQPVGIAIDGSGSGIQDGIGQGDNGKPRGRELEWASLVRQATAAGSWKNVVVLTGDLHMTAAHRYTPSDTTMAPWWEFVAGPMHAAAYLPWQLDRTFGPTVVYQRAPGHDGASPAEGFQHFGHVAISGSTGVLTVSLRKSDGSSVWSQDLTPA